MPPSLNSLLHLINSRARFNSRVTSEGNLAIALTGYASQVDESKAYASRLPRTKRSHELVATLGNLLCRLASPTFDP